MIQEIKAYRTSDERVFESEEDAKNHEVGISIKQELCAYMSGMSLDTTTKKLILDFIHENYEAIKLVINKHTNEQT